MKTIMVIQIESPDSVEVHPEEGERPESLDEFRKGYSRDLHNVLVNALKSYIENGEGEGFEQECIDNEFDELYLDGQDKFEDYGVKIKTSIIN